MKTHPSIALVALLCLVCALHAQDNVPSAPADSQAGTEMKKWIATTDAQWQAAFKRDIADVREAEWGKLKQQYLTSLEAAVTKASSAGDLDGALALRHEQKRLATGAGMIPEQDAVADATLVKLLRASVRAQLAKLEKDNAVRTKALHANYDQFLSLAQTQLTQRGRLDDALLVKNKRGEVGAAWLANLPPAATAPAPAEPPQAKGPTASLLPAPPRSAENLVRNGNFESGTEGWDLGTVPGKNSIAIDEMERRNGKPSLRITNIDPQRTYVAQRIAVKPEMRYQMSVWIKTKDISPAKPGSRSGASAGIAGGYQKTPDVAKTMPWTRVTADFVTGIEKEITFGPSLGWYHNHVTGTAWFSEVSFIELGRNAGKE